MLSSSPLAHSEPQLHLHVFQHQHMHDAPAPSSHPPTPVYTVYLLGFFLDPHFPILTLYRMRLPQFSWYTVLDFFFYLKNYLISYVFHLKIFYCSLLDLVHWICFSSVLNWMMSSIFVVTTNWNCLESICYNRKTVTGICLESIRNLY